MTEGPCCLVHAHTTWNLFTEQTKALGEKGLQSMSPATPPQCKNHPPYLNIVPNLKLLNIKWRKGCLCKLSAKSQSQTHLHLPDCQSAFNFSRLRVPVPVLSQKPYVISPQTPCAKGSLMIQASVWVAIWASPVHTPWWAGQIIWVYVCSLLIVESQVRSSI